MRWNWSDFGLGEGGDLKKDRSSPIGKILIPIAPEIFHLKIQNEMKSLLPLRIDLWNKSWRSSIIPMAMIWIAVSCGGWGSGLHAQNSSYDSNTIPISGTDNTAFGTASMNNTNTGRYNAALGKESLRALTYGLYNVAVGYRALFSNTSGHYNTAMGVQSSYSNINGMSNVGVGFSAFYSNQSGSYNTAIGQNALYTNVAGSYATAVGYGAMLHTNSQSAPFTNQNVAVGREALRGSTNSAANTGNYNTGLGYQVLFNNSSGAYNTATGNQALFANTTGGSNTAIGNQALLNNTTGGQNTATGSAALRVNTTGNYNSAFGYLALPLNTTGQSNTAIGNNALEQTTTGNNNTAVGSSSLQNQTGGSSCTALGAFTSAAINLTNATAIGFGANVTSSNTVQLGNGNVTKIVAGIGTNATVVTGGLQVLGGAPGVGKVLTSNATGVATWQSPNTGNDWSLIGNAGTGTTNFLGTTDAQPLNFRLNNQKAGRIELATTTANTFLGFLSGDVNVGTDNAGFGYMALNANVAGYGNSAFGSSALKSNDSGTFNTAIGYKSMEFSVSGIRNTSTGAGAMNVNSSGSYNSAYGFRSMMANTSGNENTGIGSGTLNFNTTGTCNTALGTNAGVSVGTLTNATAIGCYATVNASDKIRFGNATVTVVEGPVAYTGSDGRFKTNIRDEVKGLAFIQKLRPVVYNFDTRRFTQFLTQNMPDSLAADYLAADFAPSTAIRQSGFIAQEVEQAAKEVGYSFNGVHVPVDENDNYSLAYAQFVVPLVKGMQEQQAMIEAQQAQIAELQTLVHTLTQTCCAGAGTQADAPKSAQASASATTPAETAHPVEVFPNPSLGHFTVRIAPLEAGYMEVFDLRGVKVHRQDLVAGQTEYKIDLSGQASGSYLLRLQSHCGTVATKQLVIE